MLVNQLKIAFFLLMLCLVITLLIFVFQGKLIPTINIPKAKESDEHSDNGQWNCKRNGEQTDCDDTDSSKLNIDISSSHHNLTPNLEQSFGKKTPQYNSFRLMKQKVSIYT